MRRSSPNAPQCAGASLWEVAMSTPVRRARYPFEIRLANGIARREPRSGGSHSTGEQTGAGSQPPSQTSARTTRPGTRTRVDDPPAEVGWHAGRRHVVTAPLDFEIEGDCMSVSRPHAAPSSTPTLRSSPAEAPQRGRIATEGGDARVGLKRRHLFAPLPREPDCQPSHWHARSERRARNARARR
jgi:hypothetical protein